MEISEDLREEIEALASKLRPEADPRVIGIELDQGSGRFIVKVQSTYWVAKEPRGFVLVPIGDQDYQEVNFGTPATPRELRKKGLLKETGD